MDLCCTLWTLLKVVAVFLVLAIADIKRRGYSENIPWKQLLKLYFLLQLSNIKRYRMHVKFEKQVRCFMETQAKFLLGRIRRCENTAYGRDNRFSSIRSVEDFRRSQPLSEFAHFEDYVNRMADGEKSALLGEEDEICMFITSSGTTGKNKRIPLSTQGANDIQQQTMYGPLQWSLTTHFQWNLRRLVNVINGRTNEYTKAGYLVGPAASAAYAKFDALTSALYCSPMASKEVKSEFESHYIHALFGLRDKHITMIRTVFVNNFLTVMRRIQHNQQDLVADVRRGRIRDSLNIPESVRAALNAHLSPMPERAAEIEREFARGFDGIIPRLWPNLVRVSGIWSGSTNEVYYREACRMLGPDVPMVSFTYCASEGYMGSNLDITRPGTPRYTLMPTTMFYEFLPVTGDRIPDLADIKPEQLLLSDQLEVNKDYEIIITNASGFYRYRIGDVVRVVGFYQQAPQVEFLYRSGQSLNVTGEKTSEETFYCALREAVTRWPGVKLRDYTVAGSQFGPRKEDDLSFRYLLFIELDGAPLTKEQTTVVDTVLQEQSEEYSSYRRLKKLDPMVVYQVPSGTFSRFRTHLLETTPVTSGQFKMPRVLKSCEKVDWFMQNLSQ